MSERNWDWEIVPHLSTASQRNYFLFPQITYFSLSSFLDLFPAWLVQNHFLLRLFFFQGSLVVLGQGGAAFAKKQPNKATQLVWSFVLWRSGSSLFYQISSRPKDWRENWHFLVSKIGISENRSFWVTSQERGSSVFQLFTCDQRPCEK